MISFMGGGGFCSLKEGAEFGRLSEVKDDGGRGFGDEG